MSEEFDKEAEREKLREKYGDESEERETTRQMSELLLKGATMTNAHCDTCGDPIFRYDGQEFCPTCQGEDSTYGTAEEAKADQGGHEHTAQESDAADTQQTPPENPQTTPGQSTPERVEVDTPGQTGESTAPAESAQGSGVASGPTREPRTANSPAQDRRAADTPDQGGAGTGERPGSVTPASASGAEGSAGAPGDLQAAQGSLARTVSRFARAAEATDDPRAAREHLAAAREAAEALAALRR